MGQPRSLRWLIASVALSLLAGCGDDEVTTSSSCGDFDELDNQQSYELTMAAASEAGWRLVEDAPALAHSMLEAACADRRGDRVSEAVEDLVARDRAPATPRQVELAEHLIESAAVSELHPELRLEEHPGRDFGVLTDAELVGWAQSAVTGVSRQWVDSPSHGADLSTVIHGLIEFPDEAAARTGVEDLERFMAEAGRRELDLGWTGALFEVPPVDGSPSWSWVAYATEGRWVTVVQASADTDVAAGPQVERMVAAAIDRADPLTAGG